MSFGDEPGSPFEMNRNGLLVVLHLIGHSVNVNLLLEKRSQDVVDFQEDHQRREIHRLVNDALIIVLWCGEYHDQNSQHGEDTDHDAHEEFDHDRATVPRGHHGARDTHEQVDGNLLQVPGTNEKDDGDEADSEEGVLSRAEHDNTRALG